MGYEYAIVRITEHCWLLDPESGAGHRQRPGMDRVPSGWYIVARKSGSADDDTTFFGPYDSRKEAERDFHRLRVKHPVAEH